MKKSPPRKFYTAQTIRSFSESISTGSTRYTSQKSLNLFTSQQIHDLHKSPRTLKKISKMLGHDATFWLKLAAKNPSLIPDAMQKKLYQALSRYKLKMVRGTNFEVEWQASVGAQRWGRRFGRKLGIREGKNVMRLRKHGYNDISKLNKAERKILQHIWPTEFGRWMKDKDTFHRGTKKFYPEGDPSGIKFGERGIIPQGDNYHASVGWY